MNWVMFIQENLLINCLQNNDTKLKLNVGIGFVCIGFCLQNNDTKLKQEKVKRSSFYGFCLQNNDTKLKQLYLSL